MTSRDNYLKDCCPGEWYCTNCRQSKDGLAALNWPEVRALVGLLEKCLEFANEFNLKKGDRRLDVEIEIALAAFTKAARG